MKTVLDLIEKLKNDPIRDTIEQRMREFRELGRKPSNEIFKELCFCFMTANFSAAGGIRIQNALSDDFLILSESDLASRLAELGHRFPNARAEYIVLARPHANTIKETLESIGDENAMREWIVENIKGIGMKEASHFLRNIGYKNLAIIDFHIVDFLAKHGLIEKPKSKSLTPKRYVEIENILREISERAELNLGELDLYLWYLETGTVLK